AVALTLDRKYDEARAVLQALALHGPRGALGALGPSVLAVLAPVCAELRDPEWIETVYELLLPFAGRLGVNSALLVSHGPLAHQLGVLAAALGRPDAAAAHFREAMTRSERAGLSGFEARSRSALEALGRATGSKPHRAAPSTPPVLEREGELWTMR